MRFDILDASTNNQQSAFGLDSRFRLRVPDFVQESYAVLRHRGTKGNHQGFKDFADNLLTPSAFIFSPSLSLSRNGTVRTTASGFVA